MPRSYGLSAAEQKKIDDRVANANRMVANAQKILEKQRQLGNLPPLSTKASPAAIPKTKTGYIPQNGDINMSESRIGVAIIGSKGPVTLNQSSRVYGEGAHKTAIKVTGGDFPQANIGGEATVNNDNCVIGAGNAGIGISPEQLLLDILCKGMELPDVTQLLQKGYSLANIAFAIPDDRERMNRMVTVLLCG